MKEATERQLRVLRYVEAFQRAHGYVPTIREMCAALGIRSTNGITDHLAALARKGYVRRDAEKARGIVVLRGSDGEAKSNGDGTKMLEDLRLAFRLAVESAEKAVASCAKRNLRTVDGKVIVVVEESEALSRIRALLPKEGGS